MRDGVALGKDVTVRPCETTVPLFRKFSFMYIAAATNSRIDIGLALGPRATKGRVQRLATADSNRITHRVCITTAADIDTELKQLMAEAYTNGDAALEHNPKVAAGGEAKLPGEFARALKASKAAAKTFHEECTPKMRADFASYINEAKQAETRAKRSAMAIAQLAAGKKRMYC